VARDLLAKHDPDFLHVTVFMINGLQHFFGRDPLVLQGWKIIDRCVGEFLDACPEVNFLFMSDHGSNDITCKLNISTWLERQGLLVIRRSRAKQALLRLGINKDRIVRLLTRLGLRDIVKKRVGEAARNILPTSSGAVRSEGKSRLIDWERTKVYACGQGPIFLNPALPEAQRQQLRARLKERLEALRSPFDGSAIARRVYLGEEIYSGPFAGSAPDLVIDQAPGVHITSSIGFAQVFEPPGNWRGENARVGMFAAWGPHVRPGKLEAPVHIFDLAPTILHLRGLPVDADMDGRVLKEVFAEGSPPLQREVEVARYAPVAQGLRPLEGEDNPEMKRRLENLGYL
jgi:predicted AlkP superfamily phosphohydrolase/phosphomutase